MAKTRVDGTPAKATRKASPAKSTKKTTAKTKSASPERTTRSSPRRSVPSTKAQEAAADHVQTGRVTKRTSPSKATTSAKKASAAKAVKATPIKKASLDTAAKSATPVKKAASAKKSPSKSSPIKSSPTKPTSTKAKKVAEPSKTPKASETDVQIDHSFARHDELQIIVDVLTTAETIKESGLALCYEMLLRHKAELDGKARKTDDEQMRQMRSMYRKVKKAMRKLLGPGFDECLKNEKTMHAFDIALRAGLERQGIKPGRFSQNGISRESVPLIRFEDAAEDQKATKQYQATVDKRAKEMREQLESGELTTKVLQDRLAFEQVKQDRVAAGRVAKPASRAASRSKSPARSPAKRTREASVSRPVRARSKSPAKAATRTASKSPAPVEVRKTRSQSPSKPIDAQPTGTTRKRSPSKSPSKATTRTASKSPAPIEVRKTRSRLPSEPTDVQPTATARKRSTSKSPSKGSTRRGSKSSASAEQPETRSVRGRSASTGPKGRDSLYQPAVEDAVDEDYEPAPQPKKPTTKSPAKRATPVSKESPSPAKRTRSASPAKRAASVSEKNPSPAKRTRSASPVKRAASVSEKSPSPAKKARSASPAKAAPAPTSPRARSKSPVKKASPQKKSGSSGHPYKRPHPNQRGRGEIISPTNPQMIEQLKKPNPFHETLPAPEIWHRRMPPYFPFGETPFMEREISRQIEEDLARGMQESRQAQQKSDGILKRVASFATGAADAVRSTFSPSKPRKKYPSPWDLPSVGDGELWRSSESAFRDRSGTTMVTCSGSIEDSRDESEGSGSEDGSGDEYMTGGLHRGSCW